MCACVFETVRVAYVERGVEVGHEKCWSDGVARDYAEESGARAAVRRQRGYGEEVEERRMRRVG